MAYVSEYWELKLRLYNIDCKLIDKVESQLKLDIEYDLINNDFSPRHCKKCGNNKFKDNVKDKLDYLVMEYESCCSICNYVNGYWAHGHWMP